MSNLINNQSRTVGNFTFSEFTASGSDSGGETQWLAFSVTLSDGNDGLTPSLSLSGSLTESGSYTLTYLLTAAVGSNLFFDSVAQDVPCLANDSPCEGNLEENVITSSLFRRTSSSGGGIGGVNDSRPFTFNKDPDPNIVNNPIYVDTLIGYSGDGPYTGFSQTYATEVPWDTNVAPLIGATLLFGSGMWWKRRRAAANQLDLTGQGSEQEPGKE